MMTKYENKTIIEFQDLKIWSIKVLGAVLCIMCTFNTISGQDCDFFDNEIISFNSVGGNTNSEYTITYVLVDDTGLILDFGASTSFAPQDEGNYQIYGINYLTTDGVDNLVLGGEFTDVNGPCLDISDAYNFVVCPDCSDFSINTMDVELCNPNPVIISAGSTESGVSFLWSTGESGSSITVNPNITTTYSVTATAVDGCIDSSEITVTIILPLDLELDFEAEICDGESTEITVNTDPSYSILWSTGDTGTSISVSPTTTTDYSVTVTSEQCSNSGTAEIVVNPLPVVTITSSESTTICLGGSTTLQANAGGNVTYLWSNGSTDESIDVAPSSSTTYTVTATDNNGCETSSQITIEVSGVCLLCETYICPSENDCNYCEGEEVILTSVGGNQSFITVHAITDETGIILELTSDVNLGVRPFGLGFVFPVNYDAEGAVSNLSVGSNISEVSGDCLDIGQPYIYRVCGSPNVAISSSNGVSVCISEGTSLTANTLAENDVLWNTGSTANSIEVVPSTATTYSVTVSDINGCSASDQIMIDVIVACDLCEIYTCPEEEDACNFTESENVIINSIGGNNNLTTVYVLTSQLGEIIEIVSDVNLGIKPIGLGFVFPVNYDDEGFVNNLSVGNNILEVDGECLDIGLPYIYKVCLVALPLNFVEFDGKHNSELKQNELFWITNNEINTDYFLVERSIHEGDFEEIGKVKASGFTVAEANYAFEDLDITEVGNYYYRLKQIDFDGKYTYSKIIVIRSNKIGIEGKILIYPNPVLNYFNIEFIMPYESSATVMLFDLTGKLIQNNIIEDKLPVGNSKHNISIDNVPNGTYIVKVTTENKVLNQKIFVLNR